MGDLSYIQSTLETKIVGQDTIGTTTTTVGADVNQNLLVKDYADGPVTPGTVAAVSTLIGGQYNTTVPAATNTQQVAMQVDARGAILNTPLDGNRATYSASVTDLVVASAATDVFTITGSASKTVRVTRIWYTGTQTTGGVIDFSLIKRSAANSGGTSTSRTAVPHDSTSAGATATVLSYTANPTSLGAAVGTIRTTKGVVGTAATTVNLNVQNWEFGIRPSQAVVLRGTSQVLAVNLNGVTILGNSMDFDIEWTEE